MSTSLKQQRKDMIAKTISEQWNVRDELKGRTFEEIKKAADEQKLPFAVMALNVTGDMNIGMMMRTASLMGAERFIIYGMPKYDGRTVVGANNWLDIEIVDARIEGSADLDYSKFRDALDKYAYRPIFFETDGTPLDEFLRLEKYNGRANLRYIDKELVWEKPCLVFGNEGLGIPRSIILNCDDVVTIPQLGVLRSLNVAIAAGIAMHEMNKMLTKKISRNL